MLPFSLPFRPSLFFLAFLLSCFALGVKCDARRNQGKTREDKERKVDRRNGKMGMNASSSFRIFSLITCILAFFLSFFLSFFLRLLLECAPPRSQGGSSAPNHALDSFILIMFLLMGVDDMSKEKMK